MADTEEKVKYEYTGDTSSLKKATTEAISLLSKYENALKEAAGRDGFAASKTAVSSFQGAVNSLITQVNSLTAAYYKAGEALEKSMPGGAGSVGSANKDLAEGLSYIEETAGITSEDLKLLTSVLRDTKQNMAQVAGQATALATSMKSISTITTAETQAVEASTHATAASNTQTKLAARNLYHVQEAYVATNKSALDSAQAIVRAGWSAQKLKSVSDVVKQIKAEIQMMGAQVKHTFGNIWQEHLHLIVAKMQSFKDKVSDTWSQVVTRITSLTSPIARAFRRVSGAVEKTHSVLQRFFRVFTPVVSAFKKLYSAVRKAGSSLAAFIQKLRSANSSMKSMVGASSFLKKGLLALTGIRLGDWLANATRESINYIENLNLFTVAMGDAVDKGHEFINQMQEIYGLDPSNLLRYAGNFYQLATAIDMPDAAATNLSLTLTKATADISSLFNIPVEKVFEDLSSGMVGMSRAVRKYGMDIRTTTLQQTAASLGITDLVKNMSEADRQGLRFLTMMHQASNASGDFARTIEEPANQLRIFREQITQLGRSIGNFFIGPLGTAISYINGFIMALRTVLNFVGSLLGVVKKTDDAFDPSGAKDEANALENVGAAAGGAAKKMKDLIAPFDELNVLKESESGGGGGSGPDLDSEILNPAIAEAIAEMELKLENIRMKANEVRDAILEFFGFTVDFGQIIKWDPEIFNENFYNKLPLMAAEFGEKLALNLNQAILDTDWSTLGDALGNSIKIAINAATAFLGILDFHQIGESIATALNHMIDQINWSGLGTILTTKLRAIVGTVAGFINTLDMSKAAKAFSTTFKSIFASASQAIASVDWHKMGEQISDFLVNIDWAGIAENVFEAMGAAFGAAVSFLIGLIRRAWDKVIDWWKAHAEADGHMTIKGLLKGIDDALRNLLGWLKAHVLDPFVNGFKKLFQIHSPSKVMADLGGYMVEGLLDGLKDLGSKILQPFKDAWKKLKEWFNTNIKSKLTAEYWAGVLKGIPQGFKNVLNGIIESVERAFNAIINRLNSISFTAPDWVPLVGGKTFGVNLPTASLPRLARGGVISSPTYAMVGEGNYSEAVIPLDNSPQMRELVEEITDSINRRPPSDSTPVEVKVYIGQKEFDAYTYKASERGKVKVGKQPIKVGG